jgi:acyl carrier protein
MITDTVRACMARAFNTEPAQLPADVAQANFPRWDSLRHLHLVSELEMAFDVTFEPAEMGRMTSFQSVVSAIETKGG